MSRKLERISIFDDCEYTTESSVMDTLTQSAGAVFSPKNIKSFNGKLGEPKFFGKTSKKPSDNSWKFSVMNWLVESGANLLNPSFIKNVINSILANRDLGSAYIKDGDRVSNYYKYESNQVIYNNLPKQNYYITYVPIKDKKLPILVVKWICSWKCLIKYNNPLEAFAIYAVDDASKLPALMDFLMQNERNGSAYK